MLKNRVIGCLIVKGGVVVQSTQFRTYLPVGKPEIAVEFLNAWGIDEIVLLDIDATRERRGPEIALVTRASKCGLVPLTVGGGIRHIDDIRDLIHAGADKVSVNKVALTDPDLVSRAAAVFGSQCIVVSIDARLTSPGVWEVYSDGGRVPTGLAPDTWARAVERLGAGEILLTSIDRDGCFTGYDVELIRRVAGAVGIPVIVCGGAGHPRHFLEGLRIDGVSAVAAGNIFHFSEHSVITTKAYLRAAGVDVRIDTYPTYGEAQFGENGRILKAPDAVLEELIFEFIPKEVI
jgi:cyclase